MPFLDDHRRRVPPQNVYRSIVVCIRAVAQHFESVRPSVYD